MRIKIHRPITKANVKWVVIICFAAIMISTVILMFVFISPSAANIEDTNGKLDTSLAVLTLEEIVSTDDHYTALSGRTAYGGITSKYSYWSTQKGSSWKDYDHQDCTFSCKEISGVKTIQATKVTQNRLTLNISSQVEEGNVEIVIVVDGQYYDHVPINQESTVVLTDIADKTVVVKIGAESAKVKISVNRQIDEG